MSIETNEKYRLEFRSQEYGWLPVADGYGTPKQFPTLDSAKGYLGFLRETTGNGMIRCTEGVSFGLSNLKPDQIRYTRISYEVVE